MKTETAIEYAKRVYPNVSEITQLQIANAYLSGATEGMRLATEKFKGADIMDEEETEPFPQFAEQCMQDKRDEEAHSKASSNAGEIL